MVLDHRDCGVKIGLCSLCWVENVLVFHFDDNESYSTEDICEKCLREAIELIEKTKHNNTVNSLI
jgi:superfamily II helicase